MLNSEEFFDLMDEVTHRFSVANVEGRLTELLERLGWESLVSNAPEPFETFPNGKILVLGEQTVDEAMLRMTANKLGLDTNRFEFYLDYNGLQTYNYSKLAYNHNYRLIMVGAAPHSTAGTGQSASMLSELQGHPDKYPRVVVLTNEQGKLKITKSGFKKALESLIGESYLSA